ncbi:MAG: 3-isopropylmalate dehydratase small subunit [Chloroflexi bacterium]|nr:MAG: 3-isopropylmalate dehydratase small subunit [Chloroflexota bacterium]
MTPFTRHTGRAVPLDRANVDTDQIIPKEFCVRVERSGFGRFLFAHWRREPGFVLDLPQHRGASILVAGDNFGCGSSREHAVWTIQDAGFRAVIAPSFGDIFRNNCHKTGVLPVVLPAAEALMRTVAGVPATEVTVDLERQVVEVPDGRWHFEIDAFVKDCLLNGWDDIGLTLRDERAIADYEARVPTALGAPVEARESGQGDPR